MNFLIFVAWVWSTQNIVAIVVLCFMALFYVFFRVFIVPEQEKKIQLYKNFGKKSIAVDFPKPVLVEVSRPDEEKNDSNHMIWSFPVGMSFSGLLIDLQKYLDFSLNKKGNLFIRVYSGSNGVWISLKKRNEKDSWEDIILEAEEYLEIFFEKKIEFHRKKSEMVASN